MTNNDDSSDDGGGYGKPPKAYRFKPGQSGNPKGRPKGARSFKTVLDAELNARVEIVEGGRRKKITKREAIAKQFVNRALSGDPKAIPLVISQARTIEDTQAAEVTVLAQPADARTMENIVARLRGTLSPDPLLADSAPAESPSPPAMGAEKPDAD
jgi:hypothetical protein